MNIKNKMILITAFLAIMVTVTGVVSAASFAYGTVYESGTTTTISGAIVKIYADPSHLTQIGTSATTGSDGKYAIDLGLYSGTQVYITADKGNKHGETAANVNAYATLYLYPADVNINIPEFPTVALPIGAVIGLVFYFQHRKNRKE